jgi:hypothetical protein
MHGSNNVNAAGNYGTQGVPALSNEPAAVYGRQSGQTLMVTFGSLAAQVLYPF